MSSGSGEMALKEVPDRIWYLYGFHRHQPKEPFRFDRSVCRYPVRSYSHGGLNAYVSSVEKSEFVGRQAQLHLQDVAWVTEQAQLHHRILQDLMKRGSLFPLPLGTLFSSLDVLASVMEEHLDDIVDTLNHLDGCREWGMQVSLDRAQAIDARMSEVTGGLSLNQHDSPGIRHLQLQRVRKQISRGLDAWLQQWLIQLLTDIRQFSQDFSDRQRLMFDKQLRNWAFLVANDREVAFFDKIKDWQELGRRYGLQLSISGPWPPYSFCRSIE